MAPSKTPDELKADWWRDWWAADYSWDGLAHPDKYIQDGRGDSGLQDYWRTDPTTKLGRDDNALIAVGELIRAPDGRLWHIAHVPFVWADGSAAKSAWPHETRMRLAAIVTARLGAAQDTQVTFVMAGLEIVSGTDGRAQFQGCVLLDPPAHPAGVAGPIHLAATRCWLPVCDLARHVFGPGMRFDDAIFSGEINFTHVIFSGDVSFRSVIFLDKCNFHHAEFSDNCDFSHSKFVGEAIFFRTLFKNEAEFKFSTYYSTVSFTESRFKKNVDFHNNLFFDSAYFINCEFTISAQFSDTKFISLTKFDDSTFTSASFFGSIFSHGAIFDRTSFRNFTDFSNCKFQGSSSFIKAIFYGETHFIRTEFSDQCTFVDTQFQSSVSFFSSMFQETLDGNVKSGKMYFARAVFSGPVDFDGATIAANPAHHSAAFLGARFADLVSFRGCGDHWVAALDEAEIQGRILIDERDEQDALQDFDTIVLPGARDGGLNPFTGEPLLKELEGGCRTIKVAMGTARNEIMEQRYYRFQLRARREQAGVPRSERLVSYLFGLIADYGLSLTRPLLGLAVVLLFFIVVYFAFWHATGQLESASLIKSIEMAASRMFPFGAFEDVSKYWFSTLEKRGAYPYTIFFARLFASLQSLFALLLVFLFGLAVRRRFKVGE